MIKKKIKHNLETDPEASKNCFANAHSHMLLLWHGKGGLAFTGWLRLWKQHPQPFSASDCASAGCLDKHQFIQCA